MLVIMCLSDWCLVCIRRGCMHENRSGFPFSRLWLTRSKLLVPCLLLQIYVSCMQSNPSPSNAIVYFCTTIPFFFVGLYISLFYSILLIKILSLFFFHFMNKWTKHESLISSVPMTKYLVRFRLLEIVKRYLALRFKTYQWKNEISRLLSAVRTCQGRIISLSVKKLYQ